MRLTAIFLLGCALLACDASTKKQKKASSDDDDEPRKPKASQTSIASAGKAAKLDEYTIKGIQFVYFKIPAGLSREQLIETAQKLHEQEPKAQLVLVDDDSKLKAYVTYAPRPSVARVSSTSQSRKSGPTSTSLPTFSST